MTSRGSQALGNKVETNSQVGQGGRQELSSMVHTSKVSE